MTNFEIAKQSTFDMAVAILFCVVAYEEEKNKSKYPVDELTRFIERNVESIQDWLNTEVQEANDGVSE